MCPYKLFYRAADKRVFFEDNSEMIFLISQQNVCCDPLLGPSQWDSSNEGLQNMFLWKTLENDPKLPLLLLLIMSSAILSK